MLQFRETSVTQKGQVTIPVEIRRAIGLSAGDTVRFDYDPESGVVTLRRAPSVVEGLYGAVNPRAGRIELSRQELEQAVADEVMKIYSWDTEFDRVAGIQRLEPGDDAEGSS